MPITDIRLEWRWGKATPWIATLFFLVLGSVIVAIAFHRGMDFFRTSYTICLGYFVAWSIAQSHYFKVNQANPFALGLLIYPLIVGFAILAYHFGNAIFPALGVPVTFGHFVFIMLGFFFFGLDDYIFYERLSKWLKSDSLRFLFWVLVIVIIWCILFAFVLKKDDQFWQFFGMFQWVIVCLLIYALLIRISDKELNFGRRLGNFLQLFIFRFIVAYYLKYLGASWHLVLQLGTFPLLPIIMHGLYLERWPNYPLPEVASAIDVIDKGPIQLATRIVATVISIFVFGGISYLVMTTLTVINSPEELPILQWCFTVAILPLAHVWFTKYWGFKKLVIEFKKR